MKDWPTTMQVSYPVFWVEERRYRHTLAGPSGSLAMHDLVTIWLVPVDRWRCIVSGYNLAGPIVDRLVSTLVELHSRIVPSIHPSIHPHTYIYVHIHTYTYIYIHIHTYTYIHIHTYTCIYIHIHTNTYKQTN